MALINCPECGQQISDKAEVCIHCGTPLKEKPLEPVYVSFPQVSTFTGKGTVYYNGKSESCASGGTVCIGDITGPTVIEVKMTSYFGKPTIEVDPGDKIQVTVSRLGKISLSKVPTLGTNFSKNW